MKPAATLTSLSDCNADAVLLAVLEQWVCVSCQKLFSKGTHTTECARYIPLVIPWPSFWDLKKDTVKDSRTSAASLGMFFKLR